MKNIYFFLVTLLSFSIDAKPTEAKIVEVMQAKQLAKLCFTERWNKASLISLKQSNFKVESSEQREKLALQLLNCLANPDPKVRDGIAFEALSHWMRNKELNTSTYQLMFNQLIKAVTEQVDDEYGVYQPFAVLILAELARVDRKSAYLSVSQRQKLLNYAIKHLANVRDYRGFDNIVGWRHNVAHTADLLLQLFLNSNINKLQLDAILKALASQVSPSEHFYIYGEAKRLALPVAYVFLRKLHTVAEWENWLTEITTANPFGSWQDMYSSQAGLAKLHNTRAFLQILFISIKDSKNETLVSMLPALEKAIKTVG
ncbi:MAG: DUF2785 domain-containing protein [Colwellia sp.]|nr:DUF2785 domain-containing protein [Colwellia sp.]